MFIESHKSESENTGVSLVFLKSSLVQAFPCGRRRSKEQISPTGKDADKYYIPYDPEARLNTEANHLKQSGLNGFTNCFIRSWKPDDTLISLVIGGYLFDIQTEYTAQELAAYNDPETAAFAVYNVFNNKLQAAAMAAAPSNAIYANIRIEEVPLYTGFTNYFTGVLRDQTYETTPSTAIDCKASGIDDALFKSHPENYFYFAGLSFSYEPLTGAFEETDGHFKKVTVDTDSGGKLHTVSMRILVKDDTNWQPYQPAMLPNIRHGETADSIEVTTMNATEYLRDGEIVPSVSLVEQGVGTGVYRLVFSSATGVPEPAQTSEFQS